MLDSEIKEIVSLLIGAFALGYTGGLLLLIFKKAVSSIF